MRPTKKTKSPEVNSTDQAKKQLAELHDFAHAVAHNSYFVCKAAECGCSAGPYTLLQISKFGDAVLTDLHAGEYSHEGSEELAEKIRELLATAADEDRLQALFSAVIAEVERLVGAEVETEPANIVADTSGRVQ